MQFDEQRAAWLRALPDYRRAQLTALPTPIQPLPRLSAALGGPELWVKRDDLTGLPGGGNKTRKLEFLIGEAIGVGADTLVTVGAIQSNHTRQTAAAAAKVGLHCVVLHNAWAPEPGPLYRSVGNVLLGSLFGAELHHDPVQRPIEDEGGLESLVEAQRRRGRNPYAIPGGASDHPLGGLGYAAAAAEILVQAAAAELDLDFVVHCTGSSGTQAGLLAGFALLGSSLPVIGVADDWETEIKTERVHRLANATLAELGSEVTVERKDVRVIAADPSDYGVASPRIVETIRFAARTEGVLLDPVYEARAMRGLMDLVENGELESARRGLFLHLGGLPAIHAYANLLWSGELLPMPEERR